MMRALPWIYLLVAFVFIYLPVAALVLFSFQSGTLPVPPFNGPSLQWYGEILSDDEKRPYVEKHEADKEFLNTVFRELEAQLAIARSEREEAQSRADRERTASLGI